MSSDLRKEYNRLHKKIEILELEIIKQEAILIELITEKNYYFKKIRDNLRVGFTQPKYLNYKRIAERLKCLARLFHLELNSY